MWTLIGAAGRGVRSGTHCLRMSVMPTPIFVHLYVSMLTSLANDVDPGWAPHGVASDLGLHY